MLTLDVESEASTKGTIAAVTMNENDAANAVVVSDVSVYFEDAKAALAYSVEVKSGSQVYGGVVSLNGNQLQLANDITDSFVEQLNGTAGDEDITLEVTVTATDSADDTELTQSFDLTLDATGVNDAPELASGRAVPLSGMRRVPPPAIRKILKAVGSRMKTVPTAAMAVPIPGTSPVTPAATLVLQMQAFSAARLLVATTITGR